MKLLVERERGGGPVYELQVLWQSEASLSDGSTVDCWGLVAGQGGPRWYWMALVACWQTIESTFPLSAIVCWQWKATPASAALITFIHSYVM